VELLLQAPPVVASVSDTVLPIQTVDVAGVIAASAVTVTGAMTKQLVLVCVYVIFTAPPDTPVTTPVLLTVALLVFELVHVPPVVASDSTVVRVGHTVSVPVIAAGPLTVTGVLTLHAAAE
jgi:hypothetical protein